MSYRKVRNHLIGKTPKESVVNDRSINVTIKNIDGSHVATKKGVSPYIDIFCYIDNVDLRSIYEDIKHLVTVNKFDGEGETFYSRISNSQVEEGEYVTIYTDEDDVNVEYAPLYAAAWSLTEKPRPKPPKEDNDVQLYVTIALIIALIISIILLMINILTE